MHRSPLTNRTGIIERIFSKRVDGDLRVCASPTIRRLVIKIVKALYTRSISCSGHCVGHEQRDLKRERVMETCSLQGRAVSDEKDVHES